MSTNDFEEGQRVVVLDSNSVFYSHEGVVTYRGPNYVDVLIIGKGIETGFYPDDLLKVK